MFMIFNAYETLYYLFQFLIFMENPKNLIFVIFGASGDLASRMLIPAIFSLKTQKILPRNLLFLVLAGLKYQMKILGKR